MRAVEAKYIDAGGIRTRYFEAGQGTPLLLIHGGSMGSNSSALAWDTVFDTLAEDFRVFAIDKVGQGYSDNPKSDGRHSIATTYTHAYNFVKAVGIRHVYVAGHSRRAYPACRLALEHRELVKGLIVVDSGTLMHTQNPWYKDIGAKASKIADARERVKFEAVSNCYSDLHATDEWIDDMLSVSRLPKTREALAKHREMFERFEAEVSEWQKDFHARVRAGDLKMRTLIVWGYNDPSSPLDSIGLELMNLFFEGVRGVQMHILNEAGHFAYRDQPEQFASLVKGFIRAG